MTTIYFEEITSEDEAEREHEGEEVEQLGVIDMPVHTLTSDMVDAHKASQVAATKQQLAAESLPTPPPPSATASADAEALRQQGNAAFGTKRFEEAVQLYTDAIAIDRSNGALYGNRAAALLQLGRAQPALADARQMVSLMPDAAKAHFRLGSALAACNQPAEAAKALAAALRLEPSNELVAEALRRELNRPSLKKGKQHTSLVQECQEALAASKGAKQVGASDAKNASGAEPPAAARLRWREMETPAGVRPPRRGGATLTGAAGRLWLIGGADRGGAVHGDVWEYVPPSWAAAEATRAAQMAGSNVVPTGWRAHKQAASELGGRSGHAAVSVGASAGGGASVVLFGGQDPRSSVLLGDTKVLSVPSSASDDAEWVVDAAPPLGEAPEARNGHSLSFDAADGTLLLFGGANSDGHLQDLHRLHLNGLARGLDGRGGAEPPTWERPQCGGQPPAPREMHVSAVVGARRTLLIHGGRSEDAILDDLCLLSLSTWEWASVVTSPFRRVGHALALLPGTSAASAAADERPTELYAFGGFSGEAFCNDTWAFTAAPGSGATLQTEEVRARGAPQVRFAHNIAAIGDQLFVFGGSTAASELDDLHELTITRS